MQRNPSGRWCAPSGDCFDPNAPCNGTTDAAHVHCGVHQASLVPSFIATADDSLPSPRAHILPAVVSLDYGQLGLTWYDFRHASASTGFTDYQVFTAGARFGQMPSTLRMSPPLSLRGFYFASDVPGSGFVLGDYDTAASARLHAHWARRFIPTTCTPTSCLGPSGVVTWVWSPRSSVD
jgi:hypothetical protein